MPWQTTLTKGEFHCTYGWLTVFGFRCFAFVTCLVKSKHVSRTVIRLPNGGCSLALDVNTWLKILSIRFEHNHSITNVLDHFKLISDCRDLTTPSWCVRSSFSGLEIFDDFRQTDVASGQESDEADGEESRVPNHPVVHETLVRPATRTRSLQQTLNDISGSIHLSQTSPIDNDTIRLFTDTWFHQRGCYFYLIPFKLTE